MSPIEVPSALSEVMPDDPRRRLPILCATYEPRGDSRRCKHFVPNGACVLPTEFTRFARGRGTDSTRLRPSAFMCTEWLRVNRSGRQSTEVDEHGHVALARHVPRAVHAPPPPLLRPPPLQATLFPKLPTKSSA